jgi:hypothetical protein
MLPHRILLEYRKSSYFSGIDLNNKLIIQQNRSEQRHHDIIMLHFLHFIFPHDMDGDDPSTPRSQTLGIAKPTAYNIAGIERSDDSTASVSDDDSTPPSSPHVDHHRHARLSTKEDEKYEDAIAAIDYYLSLPLQEESPSDYFETQPSDSASPNKSKRVSFEDQVSITHISPTGEVTKEHTVLKSPALKLPSVIGIPVDAEDGSSAHSASHKRPLRQRMNECRFLEGMSHDLNELHQVLLRRENNYGHFTPRVGQTSLFNDDHCMCNRDFRLARTAFLEAIEGLGNAIQWHQISEARHGRDHGACLDVANCLETLAVLYSHPHQGSTDLALSCLRLCVDVHERHESGPLEISRLFDSMAGVHYQADDYDEAKRCHLKATSKKREAFGRNDHISMVPNYLGMACISHIKKCYYSAAALLITAIGIQENELKRLNQERCKEQARQLPFAMAEASEHLAEVMRQREDIKYFRGNLLNARDCYIEAGLPEDHPRAVAVASTLANSV